MERGRACFSSYFSNLPNYEQVRIYIEYTYPEQYKDHLTLTREEIIRYVELLNEMGMKLTVTFDMPMEFPRKHGEESNTRIPAIAFDLHPKENSPLVTLMLAHAVRDIYEADSDRIVRAFLKFADDPVKGINLYNRYILARVVVGQLQGHDYSGPYGNQFRLLSQQEVNELILGNQKATSVGYAIPTLAKKYSVSEAQRAYKKGEPLVAIYKAYRGKTRCTKKSPQSVAQSNSASIPKEKVLV